MINMSIFTKMIHVAMAKNVATWFDDSPLCCGRGQRFDKVFIDKNFPKQNIEDIIIPSCSFGGEIIYI